MRKWPQEKKIKTICPCVSQYTDIFLCMAVLVQHNMSTTELWEVLCEGESTWWVTTTHFQLAVMYSVELYLRYTQIFFSSFRWFIEMEPHKAIDVSWGMCPGTIIVNNLVSESFAHTA